MSPIMASGLLDCLGFIGTNAAADALQKAHPAPHRLRVCLGLDAKVMVAKLYLCVSIIRELRGTIACVIIMLSPFSVSPSHTRFVIQFAALSSSEPGHHSAVRQPRRDRQGVRARQPLVQRTALHGAENPVCARFDRRRVSRQVCGGGRCAQARSAVGPRDQGMCQNASIVATKNCDCCKSYYFSGRVSALVYVADKHKLFVFFQLLFVHADHCFTPLGLIRSRRCPSRRSPRTCERRSRTRWPRVRAL